MNEELQNALATLLAKTTSAAEAGVSFLQAELPEVIRQLLMWHAVRSAVFFILLLAASGVLLYVASRCYRAYQVSENEYGNKSIDLWMGTAFGIWVSICLGALSLTNLDWLQIWIAPKVYLIEYAASLAK